MSRFNYILTQGCVNEILQGIFEMSLYPHPFGGTQQSIGQDWCPKVRPQTRLRLDPSVGHGPEHGMPPRLYNNTPGSIENPVQILIDKRDRICSIPCLLHGLTNFLTKKIPMRKHWAIIITLLLLFPRKLTCQPQANIPTPSKYQLPSKEFVL